MKKLFILAVFCFTASQAFSWNSVGHRAVAELAWRQMSPKERAAATDLLKQHPHYEIILTADVPKGVDTNQWAFLTAAVWPDLVRPARSGQTPRPEFVTKYNVHPHGIDLPFLAPGETNRALLSKPFKADKDVREVLSNAIATLKNRKASVHDRAVSLCWVLHLMADTHQPLHAAAPLSSGKSRSYVVRTLDGEELSFHTFWDYLPGPDQSYEGVTALADALSADPELKKSKLREYKKHKTTASWVQESYEAAVGFAYAPEKIKFVNSPDSKAKTATAAITPAYAADAERVAHRRLALAGFRLTKVLTDAF